MFLEVQGPKKQPADVYQYLGWLVMEKDRLISMKDSIRLQKSIPSLVDGSTFNKSSARDGYGF